MAQRSKAGVFTARLWTAEARHTCFCLSGVSRTAGHVGRGYTAMGSRIVFSRLVRSLNCVVRWFQRSRLHHVRANSEAIRPERRARIARARAALFSQLPLFCP